MYQNKKNRENIFSTILVSLATLAVQWGRHSAAATKQTWLVPCRELPFRTHIHSLLVPINGTSSLYANFLLLDCFVVCLCLFVHSFVYYGYNMQGIKRLSCSLYFSAHPEQDVHHSSSASSVAFNDSSLVSFASASSSPPVASTAAAAAKLKTNPNWRDIRYDPQHHRLARGEGFGGEVLGGGLGAAGPVGFGTPVAKGGLWSGAKV